MVKTATSHNGDKPYKWAWLCLCGPKCRKR